MNAIPLNAISPNATLLNIPMGNIKEINIKNRTYHFFDDTINITNFDPNLLQIDKKLTVHLIIDQVDG